MNESKSATNPAQTQNTSTFTKSVHTSFPASTNTMAIQCKYIPNFSCGPYTTKPMSPISIPRFSSPQKGPVCTNPHFLKMSRTRGAALSAVVSEESAVESSNSGSALFKLTYLEGNSWLWDVGGVKILVDPILVGNLDFGIPWFYDAAKRFIKNFQLDNLPEIDCLLITQSLDDHCHLKTLKPLSQKSPTLRVIATPNAKPLLDPLFSNVTYLEPGEETEIQVKNGSPVKIKATAGPVLGPPWQRPENGYLVTFAQSGMSLYYEPHCVYKAESLEKARADIVITPVTKQLLPYFTLVSGQEDAVQLAKLLNARFIVPMRNGELDSKGLLASIVQSEGTIESFKEMLSKELPNAAVLEPTPGEPLDVPPPV